MKICFPVGYLYEQVLTTNASAKFGATTCVRENSFTNACGRNTPCLNIMWQNSLLSTPPEITMDEKNNLRTLSFKWLQLYARSFLCLTFHLALQRQLLPQLRVAAILRPTFIER